jgi:tetratricopeptide (TPR) repeat protein
MATRRAAALDPSLAEAHNALAMASLLDAWDTVEAEREFLLALELNPRYIQARDWYALFYLQLTAGRLAEGVTQAKLAVESDPLSGYANAVLGLTCSVSGRHAEAMQFSERGVQLDPDSFIARWILHIALYFSGRLEESVAVGEAALAMSGRHPWAMATLAVAFADWGRPADAEAVYAELMARARRCYVQPSELAFAAAAAGMRDETICHAREALQIRDPFSRIKFSKYWPYSSRLRDDSRFHDILLKLGLD